MNLSEQVKQHAKASVLMLVCLLAACSGKDQKAVTIAPALTVTVTHPIQASWTEQINASGAIAPWQEAVIGSQIGGYQLTQVRVNVGDHVHKGQVLARMNSDLLKAEEVQLHASYEQAQANAKRALSLQASGSISEQDILQATTLVKTARGQLDYKQLQLRYTEVIAPDDGIISSRTATVGAVVSSGQELFRMILKGRLEWRGELTAEQLVQIAPHQQISLALPGGASATAQVRQLAPTLDSNSRLGTVYADITNGEQARAGMYANGAIMLKASPALVIPAQSIVIRDGRSYVLTLHEDGSNKLTQVAVTTGRRQGSQIEIVKGLSSKDQVVVSGAGFLNDGDVVRVVTEPVAVPAAPVVPVKQATPSLREPA
ncbi:RND family efflux transporter MFP subunit [Herbaspirillum sp. Sphag1AN]|uniref:efflux RND transporter periplasmic adaptor subunit n=1 Tax=unclassified Herbaspirillum TaxID=2624150 RepID=UPI00161FC266|nr:MULTISPECIES: efflux RND transporter periplasmic adaptor subunit [unclassified Herbaspirillum]MBB3212239.1 RND family efflux transporter MFP subunit [Herbaspirillum sp. Sphag1AN]MBB3245663.1 RND family efflux transporter MFP subunit [Herbaspirillum sp. Sphag64]